MYRYRVKRMGECDDRSSYERINLEPYIEFLQFTRAIDPDQRDQIKKATEDKPIAIADLLAALVYRLFITETLERNAFVEKCLRCCEAMLENEGFDIVDINDVLQTANEAIHCLVLAPGCQTDELLMSRVRATEEVCYKLVSIGKPVQLFFSGKNPGLRAGVPPSILNESKTMQMWFWDLWARRQQASDFRRLLNIRLLTEDASKTSVENIKRILEMSRSRLQEGGNIFIVSSTFHLIRLAKALENELRADDSLRVSSIVLVGSEISASNVSMHKAYVKSMVFNLFRYFISKSEFW